MTWKVTERAFSSHPDQGSKTMGSQLMFWLLGAALMLPWTKALICNKGHLIYDNDRSAFPISWTTSQNETCQPGEGCQETLIILESGNRVCAVFSIGCTRAQAHESIVSQHRGPPGVTIASFTKVCYSELCNDLHTTLPLWTMEPTDAPAEGGLRCPVCVSSYTCPSDAPLVTCPLGTAHCYSGTIQLFGGGISLPLRVQGCVPHDGCQLLNGTKMIGPISLTESCESEGSQDTRALVCFKGHLIEVRDKSDFPISWNGNIRETCEPGEGCQDTLILLESGDRVATVISKGCQRGRTQEPISTWHGRPPGVTITSYTHVCHSDLCNNLSSSIPLWHSQPPTGNLGQGEGGREGRRKWVRGTKKEGQDGSRSSPDPLPPQAAAPSPDGLQCPACVALGSSCSNTSLSLCPSGTSHCYKGQFQLSGGRFTVDFGVQGCAPKAVTGCHLLGNTKAFGPIAVNEVCQEDSQDQSSSKRVTAKPHNRVSATTAQAWGMAAGLLLALWGCLPSL
ncbi:CD177 antigen [Petaurus breviceps papuanus]|uniref:CD177 antigen n=1 Tax=Petaurus breviceps papuanus TaxID=3040969 RepID=UPI0036DA26D2